MPLFFEPSVTHADSIDLGPILFARDHFLARRLPRQALCRLGTALSFAFVEAWLGCPLRLALLSSFSFFFVFGFHPNVGHVNRCVSWWGDAYSLDMMSMHVVTTAQLGWTGFQGRFLHLDSGVQEMTTSQRAEAPFFF